jgi:predicted O-methyltransferase YrrM
MVGVNTNDAEQVAFINNVLPRHMPTFRANYPLREPAKHGDFFLLNGSYMAVDAHVYHALIREHRPKRIVEIGTGYSTIMAADIARRMREAGEQPPHITAIDPYPWDVFKNGMSRVDDLVAEKVQDVPMDRFTSLEAGDFLFIDSTHVLRANSDVLYEFLEILPRLKPGVWVHIHDISLPLPYPRVYFDTQTYWNEQWLLQAFLTFNSRFKVVWAGNYMMLNHRDLMLSAFPEFRDMREKWTSSEPTAFWIRST